MWLAKRNYSGNEYIAIVKMEYLADQHGTNMILFTVTQGGKVQSESPYGVEIIGELPEGWKARDLPEFGRNMDAPKQS